MPPTLKKLKGHIALGLSIRASVLTSTPVSDNKTKTNLREEDQNYYQLGYLHLTLYLLLQSVYCLSRISIIMQFYITKSLVKVENELCL